MKTINIQYFAILREQAGKPQEDFQTSAETPLQLYRQLAESYQFSLDEAVLRCAINDEYRPFDAPLQDGDKVVFIPPVAGG